MAEVEINEEFCFDTSKKLTIEIAHKALKNYSENLSAASELENSIPIILDTNVLLQYYGMSQVEKKKLIKFLNQNKDRIFLTAQIEKEFLRNRIKVINSSFFTPLKGIPAELEKMYEDVKNKFKSFLNNRKNILENDYPNIWYLLLEKEEKLNEIFEDKQILSESLAQEIETTTMDYKHIHLVDKLLEVCTNFKITPPLSDKEEDFVRKQYDALSKKYEQVKELERREITFPGCGDRSNKEDPYGDFIIFHEILKFMVSEKDGLDKTDVIFLTLEKVKGDWFYKDLAPITHYIEKAFLLTDKILFITHADKPLKLSFENIHKTNPQVLVSENWLEDKLYSIGKRGLFSENYMGHYRGWTIMISFSSANQEWGALAINTICYSYATFIEINNDEYVPLRILGQWLPTKEEAYTDIKAQIDESGIDEIFE